MWRSETSVICLDETDISPTGQSQIEPCDLLTDADETAVFYHIKRSTLSSQLSHLFNQGMNAIEAVKIEPQSLGKLIELIRSFAHDLSVGSASANRSRAKD